MNLSDNEWDDGEDSIPLARPRDQRFTPTVFIKRISKENPMSHTRMLKFTDGTILTLDGVAFSFQSPTGHYYLLTSETASDFLRRAMDAEARGLLPAAAPDLPEGVNTCGIVQTDPSVQLLDDKVPVRDLDARVSLGMGAERHDVSVDTKELLNKQYGPIGGKPLSELHVSLLDVTTLDGSHVVAGDRILSADVQRDGVVIGQAALPQYRVVKGSNFEDPYFMEEWAGEATIDPVAADREVQKMNGLLPHFGPNWYRVVTLPYVLNNPEETL